MARHLEMTGHAYVLHDISSDLFSLEISLEFFKVIISIPQAIHLDTLFDITFFRSINLIYSMIAI